MGRRKNKKVNLHDFVLVVSLTWSQKRKYFKKLEFIKIKIFNHKRHLQVSTRQPTEW